jgi:hypothetical protein
MYKITLYFKKGCGKTQITTEYNNIETLNSVYNIALIDDDVRKVVIEKK